MKVFAWICAGLMALAVIPAYADSGCSEKHENVSRFNPTELSDYQKCVFKWTGQEAGTVGNYVWFQLDGQFFHMKKEDVARDAKESITRAITNAQLDAIKAQARADAKHITEEMLAAAVRGELAKLPTYAEQLRIAKATANATDLSDAIARGIVGTFAYTSNITDSVNRQDSVTNIGTTITFNDYEELVSDLRGDLLQLVGTRSANYTATIDAVTLSNGAQLDLSTYGIGQARKMTIARNGNIWYDPNISVVADNVTGLSLSELQTIVQSAYNKGYNDGYDAGYDAGYKQGFADGVASVK